MKNSVKYLVAALAIVTIPSFANASISVKDTTSPEFIHNQGYSSETSRIIEVKTKDLSTPIAAEEEDSNLVKFTRYIRNVIDPTYTEGRKTFVNHNTHFEKTTHEDL